MDPAYPIPGPGAYPERADAPAPAADRLLATLAQRFHNRFRREAAGRPVAGEHAARFAAAPLGPQLPPLRYRLRRDGLAHPGRLEECLGFAGAVLSQGGRTPAPEAMAAAAVLLQGGVADLADAGMRLDALALAAVARAIEGVPVHVLAASDAGAERIAQALREPLAALGMETGCLTAGLDARARQAAYAAAVVCGAHREIGIDYLRDRLRLGGRPRPLAGLLERLSGQGGSAQPLLLRGLHCALVDEADVVLVDEAHLPLAISTEADQAAERLLYEQALELARALVPQSDFEAGETGARLTEGGAQRVARLVGPLGGFWAARERREEILALALDVLHRLQPGTDYRVEQGRVRLLGVEAPGGEPEETDPVLQHLIEVKEGCRLSGRRDVLVRLSVPRFFRRYLHLAGICADARGLERELWDLYSLTASRAGPPVVAADCVPCVYATVQDKHGALAYRARTAAAAGESVVIAVRTPPQAQALAGVLEEAGLSPGVISGTGGAPERLAMAGLDAAGGVAIVLYPADRRVDGARRGRVRRRLIVAELHDARRHVARLARTFVADTCELVLSLEDEAVARQLAPALLAAARGARRQSDGALSPAWSRWLARAAQRGLERTGRILRLELATRDQYLDDLLAFSGRRE